MPLWTQHDLSSRLPLRKRLGLSQQKTRQTSSGMALPQKEPNGAKKQQQFLQQMQANASGNAHILKQGTPCSRLKLKCVSSTWIRLVEESQLRDCLWLPLQSTQGVPSKKNNQTNKQRCCDMEPSSCRRHRLHGVASHRWHVSSVRSHLLSNQRHTIWA